MARKRQSSTTHDQDQNPSFDPAKAFGPRQRADLLLIARGLFESRAQAQAAIEAGCVIADGNIVTRASDTLPLDAVIEAQAAHPWVSRGGIKLSHALEEYGADVAGHICLDVGASTGGFSQVLLARNAAKIYAVDVGRDQLHPKLRNLPGLVSIEETDIRSLNANALDPKPDFVVIDASFISLHHILPAALALAARPCILLALIKPQFEVARADLKKGIVRDETLRGQVCAAIESRVADLGGSAIRLFPSPIAGGDGNIEFFIGARFI